MLIQVNDVEHTFRTPKGESVVAINGLSFHVNQGEFVSILGPSGCGKTTTLRMMDGLLRPTGGHIIINGKIVERPGYDRAMVFQDSGLFPWRTTLENVEMGLEFQRRSRAERSEKVRSMIDLVGLQGFERSYPHQLSGGMRQRVGLARAFAIDPNIFLMDEPFGALDAQTREIMQEELLRLWGNFHRTVVFITHSIDEAIYLSDRVIIMSARPGRVKLELPIPIKRPRWQTDVKATREFSELRTEAWSVLKSEITAIKR